MQKLVAQIEKGRSFFGKLSRNIYLGAIHDESISAMSVVLFLGIFLLIAYMPNIFGFKWDRGMEAILMKPYNYMMGLIAFLVAGTTAKSLADSFNRKLENTNQINFVSTMLAVMCGFLFLASDPAKDGGFLNTFTGTKGLLMAFLLAFVTVIVYSFCMEHNIMIKIPKEVPSNASQTFKDLIPFSAVIITLYALDLVIHNGFESNVAEGILKLFELLFVATDGWIDVTVIFGIFALFWFVGIHDPLTVEPAITTITYANIEANLKLLQAGEHVDKVITSDTQVFIITFGGIDATLVVPFISMWTTRSKRNKAIGRVSVVPAFFDVNEPILFGAPLVLNPVFFILFVLAPTANVWVFRLFVEVLGMNSFSVNLLRITPGPLGIIMGTGFGLWSFVLAITLIVVDTIIYYPFLEVCDSEILDEGGGCKENNSDLKEKVAANFDTKKADSVLAAGSISNDAVKASNIIEQANVLALCVGGGTNGLLVNALNKAAEEYHVPVKVAAGGYGVHMDVMKEYQLIVLTPRVTSSYKGIRQGIGRLGIKLARIQGAEYIKLIRDGQTVLDFAQQQFEN